MKQKAECMYCGKPFMAKVKKMWVIWLCNVTEMETVSESGETVVIHEKQKIKSCGAMDNFQAAEDFKIKGMKKDQCKDIQKVITVQDQFCPKCTHDAKVYHDRVMARMKKDARKRAVESGDKSGKIASIPDQDYRGYIRYLVESRIATDYKRDQQHQAQLKKAEEQKRLMVEKEKVNKPESPKTVEESKHEQVGHERQEGPKEENRQSLL